MILINDYHCHLYSFDNGKGMEMMLSAAASPRGSMPGEGGGMATCGTVFCNIREKQLWRQGSIQAAEISGRTGVRVVPFIGIHPWDVIQGAQEASSLNRGIRQPAEGVLSNDEALYYLEKTTEETGAFIGETGLDRLKGAPAESQLYVFGKTLDIAARLKRPFTIHCVRQWGALLDELGKREGKMGLPFIVHAYSGSFETMERLISLGGYISFGTGRDGHFSPKAQQCIERIDIRRLLLETDYTFISGDDVMTGQKPSGDSTGRNPAGTWDGYTSASAYRDSLDAVYLEAARVRGCEAAFLCGEVAENCREFMI